MRADDGIVRAGSIPARRNGASTSTSANSVHCSPLPGNNEQGRASSLSFRRKLASQFAVWRS